jgi:ribosomal protein S30
MLDTRKILFILDFQVKYIKINKANKAVKMTPRIPPKNGGVFTPGSVIRLEFPAQVFISLNLGICQSCKHYFVI